MLTYFINIFFLLLVNAFPVSGKVQRACSTSENEGLHIVREFQSLEAHAGVSLTHGTKALLHKNSSEAHLESPIAIGALHGLFNSPRYLQALSEHIFLLGYNVLNARLAKHFEGKRKNLDFANYQNWFDDGSKVSTAICGFGSKKVLLGHSIGALTMAKTALDHPARVEGLILLSPAFATTKVVKVLTSLSQIGVSGHLLDSVRSVFGIGHKDQRYLSTYAGAEAEKAIQSFWKSFNSVSEEQRRSFLNIPVLVIDTARDSVVDISVTKKLQKHFTHPLSKRVVLSRELKVSHNATPSGPKYTLPNPEYRLVFDEITLFLEAVKRLREVH